MECGISCSLLSIFVLTLWIHIRTSLIQIAWNVYHGAKGVGIFISIIAFSFVSAEAYKYREREEIVNEQAIIEEVYERELLMNSDTDIEIEIS